MIRRVTSIGFCIALLLVLAGSVMLAQVQVFTSRAGFEAATGATNLPFPTAATVLGGVKQ